MIINNIINKYPSIYKLINYLDYKNILSNFTSSFFKLNKPRITCIQIHITNECDLNCIYCYAKNHVGKILTKQKIFSLVKESKKLGIHEIQFVGGEPFQYKYLKELIKFTIKQKIKIRIYTNGLNINKEWIKFFKKNNNIILMFKFDSSNGYKYHLKKDIYKKIVSNIIICKKNKIKINTFIVVTKKNFKDIEFLIKKSFSMKSIPVIERYLPANSEKINSKLEINQKEWNHVLKIYNKYNKKFLPFYKLSAKMLNFYCSCYNSTLSIDTNGEALPCPYAPKELSIGNVNKKNLNALYKIYFSKIKEWNKIPKGCSSCKEINVCKGGCKTYVFLKKKKLNKKDPLCDGIPPNITMCAFNNKFKIK
jgi:radical SAM protein with 4Fe4S-binding SPASM domain